MKIKNQNQNEIKTVYYQGIMLIGEMQLKNGKYRMYNPLMIRQLPLTEGNEQQIHLSPFGMGFFENPIFLPPSIIVGKTTAYGVKQYLNAITEIRKIVSAPKKENEIKNNEEDIDNQPMSEEDYNNIQNEKINVDEELKHSEIIETATDLNSVVDNYINENHDDGDNVEENNEERKD